MPLVEKDGETVPKTTKIASKASRSGRTSQPAVSKDWQSLSRILLDMNSPVLKSRPDLERTTGLGRSIVSQQVEIGIELKLLTEGKFGESKGGRAPRLIEFNKNLGYLLIAELGATGMSVACTDLCGSIHEMSEISIDISVGPEKVLKEIEKFFDKFRLKNGDSLWGIGIGLPGPVEFAKGVPMSPPIMPGWDKYAVRERFESRYGAPVWIDNDVNLMALGETRLNQDKKHEELIYIKIGTGIGAGIISTKRLHRGAQGSAGDIGHIAISEPSEVSCRCGNFGCLEAVAGGAALARNAMIAVEKNESSFLAERFKRNKILTGKDVTDGARSGDVWSVEAVTGAGRQVGQVLATLINFFNPSLVIIGGGVSSAGDLLLASIRETVYRRSLPLATRDLEIRLGDLDDRAGLRGASEMVLSELLSADILKQRVELGKPQIPLAYNL